METQKELDFLAAQHRPHDLHRAVAAGIFKRISTPNLYFQRAFPNAFTSRKGNLLGSLAAGRTALVTLTPLALSISLLQNPL